MYMLTSVCVYIYGRRAMTDWLTSRGSKGRFYPYLHNSMSALMYIFIYIFICVSTYTFTYVYGSWIMINQWAGIMSKQGINRDSIGVYIEMSMYSYIYAYTSIFVLSRHQYLCMWMEVKSRPVEGHHRQNDNEYAYAWTNSFDFSIKYKLTCMSTGTEIKWQQFIIMIVKGISLNSLWSFWAAYWCSL